MLQLYGLLARTSHRNKLPNDERKCLAFKKDIEVSKRDKFREAADRVFQNRDTWYDSLRKDKEYESRGGLIYPYDTISANIDPLFYLLDSSGIIEEFEDGRIAKVCDVGCANGELSYCFSMTGFETTAVDFSYKHDQAPYIVSAISRQQDIPVAVIDTSVDTHFDLSTLKSAIVYDPIRIFPEDSRFDLVVCFGLLYHLKNPFAFLESLAKVSRYVALGTHLFTHLPNLRVRLDTEPVAYLVDSGELNGDPTNFWVFSEMAFHRLVRRAGFEIVASQTIPNHPLEIAVPDRTDLGVRGFVMLKSIA